MPDVQPFCGLRYNPERISDISSVISPPYDVISSEEQQLYYHRSPYNIIRLELGKTLPTDSLRDNRYTRAAVTLRSWLDEGILVRDEQPAFYIFEHRFLYRGVVRSRWELVARVRLQDWSSGQIRPHEATVEQYRTDRLLLLRSCRANISPILGIVPYERSGLLALLLELAKGDPVLSVSGDYGVIHNMWVVTDERDTARVSAVCGDRVLYVADGHHRYETALNYNREQVDAGSHYTGDEAFNFVMMALVDEGDPGLLVLPLHRLVRSPGSEDPDKLRERLNALFYISEVQSSDSTLDGAVLDWLNMLEERGKKETALGVYGLGRGSLCLLVPRDRAALESTMPSHHSSSWRRLDVSLLHWTILRGIMEIDTAAKESEHLGYTPDALEAIRRVHSGEYQFAFLMNPMPISSILAVADANDRMLPKSTYFYPKPPTGLVMNPLWDY